MNLKITRMTAAIGATVEGADLNRLDDATFAGIRQVFLDNCVIAIRNQDMRPESLIAFGRRFGKLVMSKGTEVNVNRGKDHVLTEHQGFPEILRINNLGKRHTLTELWHADNVHVPRPTAISILAAESIPAIGGDTMFCNQYHAYEALSPAMKRLLRGLRLRHSGAKFPAYKGMPDSEIPFALHPVVRTHPETGRRSLFLGGAPSVARNCFEGFTPEETLPLQKFLFEHSYEPHRCYRHRWQAGDVLMWDNRCVMHYAVHDYGDETRDMNRVTVEGDVPFEAHYDD